MGDDRAPAYWEVAEDGTERAVFRASALGSLCEASLVRALVGQPAEPPPAWLQEKFDQGNEAEAKVFDLLERRYGWKMLGPDRLSYWGPVQSDGQIKTELHVGKHRVRCHPDAVLVRVDREGQGDESTPDWAKLGALAVGEGKAFSESTYKKWKVEGLDVIAPYKIQVAVEMLTTGLPCVYVVGVKGEDGKVLADRCYVKYYTDPPVSRVEIAKKVMRIVNAAKDHEAGRPMMPCVEGGQYPCAFYRMSDTACGVGGKARATVDDDETAAKIAHWARFYLTGETIKKSGEHKMAEAKARLLELVHESTDTGPYRISYSSGGNGKVSWKAVASELRGELGIDEADWMKVLDEHTGEPGAPSVTVKMMETNE